MCIRSFFNYCIKTVLLVLVSFSCNGQEYTYKASYSSHGQHKPHEGILTKTITDSLYILNYVIGPVEGSNGYTYYARNDKYYFIPDTSAIQKVVRNSSGSETTFKFLKKKTYYANGRNYDVFVFSPHITSSGKYISSLLYYWIPEFGIERQRVMMGGTYVDWSDKTNEYRSLITEIDKHKGFENDSFLIDDPEVWDKLQNQLQSLIKYPENENRCMSGVFRCPFKIDTTGQIKGVYYARGNKLDFYEDYELFEKECKKVLEAFRSWKPVTFRGKPIYADGVIELKFEVPDSSLCINEFRRLDSLREEGIHGEVFTIVEDPAYYPGGVEVFMNRVKNSLKSFEPKQPVKGSIVISFIVRRKGKVTDINIVKLKGIDIALQKKLKGQIEQYMKNDNNWKPAAQRGNPVNQKIVLTIDIE